MRVSVIKFLGLAFNWCYFLVTVGQALRTHHIVGIVADRVDNFGTVSGNWPQGRCHAP